MSSVEVKIEEELKPRFEFRTFGQDFSLAAKRMARFSMPVPEKIWERFSDEIYIVSRTNDRVNTKIRDGKIDIKVLEQTVDGLEQWRPLMKAAFPVNAEVLRNELFPAFELIIPGLNKDVYTLEEFIDIIYVHPVLQAVRVHKQRFGYLVNDVICETGSVLINGAKVATISAESTEIRAVKKVVQDIGIDGVENINYLQAIKRVLGLDNRPLAN